MNSPVFPSLDDIYCTSIDPTIKLRPLGVQQFDHFHISPLTRQHERRDFVLGCAEWLLDVGAAFQQRLDDAQMAADDGNVNRLVGKPVAAIDARDTESSNGLILGHGEIVLDKSIEKEIHEGVGQKEN